MRHWTTGLILAAAAVLTACVPMAQREQLNPGQWEAVAATLESDGSVDALVAAALVRRVTLGDARNALSDLDRALQLAPDQPDAAWLALSICFAERDCAQSLRSAQLLGLAPQNAAGRYASLSSARANADVAAEDLALAAMADAQYFDIYWSRLLTRTVDALSQPRGPAQRPLREPAQAGIEVIGWLAAVAIPPLSATSATCKDERLKREDVVAWCRKLAEALVNGDTYIVQMVGNGIAARVWTPESPELARFLQRKREYRYVQEQTYPYQNTTHATAESTKRWLDRYRVNRSEHDVYRAWLVDLGIPPDPPANWQPASEKPLKERQRIALQ